MQGVDEYDYDQDTILQSVLIRDLTNILHSANRFSDIVKHADAEYYAEHTDNEGIKPVYIMIDDDTIKRVHPDDNNTEDILQFERNTSTDYNIIFDYLNECVIKLEENGLSEEEVTQLDSYIMYLEKQVPLEFQLTIVED